MSLEARKVGIDKSDVVTLTKLLQARHLTDDEYLLDIKESKE